ncbi:hypothetical protein ACHAXA_010934 [Cyclostephanos tholiformis]|uniref:Uncharacterized protein n=1 Tax=Cyclostephanos tholiformis TaxID=382380 RepID=A0ABD3R7L1_9STRA
MKAPMQNHSFRQTYQFLSWHPTIFLASNVARTALAVSTRRGHRRGRLADRPRTTSAADRRRSVDATSPKTEEDNADEYYDDVEEDGETMTNEVATKYAMEENAVYDGEDTDDASTADVETRPSSSSSPLIGGGGGDELCSPVEECELCHRSWRVMIEKEDEKISGEYESCATYGRRRKFECTVLSRDEQFRMKVVSASLFDLRRMRIQGGANSGNSGNSPKPNGTFPPPPNSMETPSPAATYRPETTPFDLTHPSDPIDHPPPPRSSPV